MRGRDLLIGMFIANATALAQSQPLVQTLPAVQSRPAVLAGFQTGGHFGEQITSYRFEPEVAIHINAPPPDLWDAARPTRLILYTLPNGSTTAETIGRKPAPGRHWRYHIQHIGAQVRRLREAVPAYNWVVAYLEADGKSWPAWKARHPDYRDIIPRIVEDIVKRVGGERVALSLSGHSGGGSFIFGYIDSCERIPAQVERISFLDSNYGYDDERAHGDKLIAWLRGGRKRTLSVICYDDRNIMLDGKLIVGPTGGTWRKTQRMIERLRKDIELTERPMGNVIRLTGLDGRIDIIMHPNPQNKILHTSLVGDMNGLIHAMTVGTEYEGKAGKFAGPVAYEKWIEP